MLISTHIADSIGNEVHRLPGYCVQKKERYLRGESPRHKVTREILDYLP